MPYYELHITVAENSSLETFNEYCHTKLRCKANLIELSQGTYPLQLMLAKKGIVNTDEEALEWGDITKGFVEIAKWTPTRVKVESPLMPGPSIYFEAHWKFDLGMKRTGLRPSISQTDMVLALEEFALAYPGFLRSRNVGNSGVYYYSVRSYQPDFAVAAALFDKYHRAVVDYIDFVVPLDGVHYERVLFDSNPSLDEGWTA
jgi:hypothetical protein